MDIKELVRTGMFSVGYLMCHTKKSRVVYYHDVHVGDSWTKMSTPFELFKLHISAIRKSGFEIVRDINNPKGEIQIAFDDGFRGLLDCMDWLVPQRIYPTIFIPISLIGKEGYLSESEILELHNAGFNIQSHGIRHKNMSAMPVDELLDDLYASKAYLENFLDKQIDSICYPQGYYSDRVISESQNAGYKKLYISVPGVYDMDVALKHRTLFQTMSPLQVRLTLYGGMDILSSHYKKMHYNTIRKY